MVNSADRLLDLCSSFSRSDVVALNSIFRQQSFDHKAFKEQLSSIADCNKIIDTVLQRTLLEALFHPVKVAADRNVLYTKVTVEYLQKQLQLVNVDRNLHFWSAAFRYEERSVQQPMESKLSVDICSVGRIELISFAEKISYGTRNIEDREKFFVKFVWILLRERAATIESFTMVVYLV